MSVSRAFKPLWVSREPIRTRSGSIISWMAVPSARNSGLDRTSKQIPPFSGQLRILSMARAVFTGRVLFSMTILDDREWVRICRAVCSQYWRSAAMPALSIFPSSFLILFCAALLNRSQPLFGLFYLFKKLILELVNEAFILHVFDGVFVTVGQLFKVLS